MKLIRLFSIFLLAIISVACGDTESYTLDITIEGLGTRNVNLYIYTRGGLKTVSIPAVDGKLTYKSGSKEPVLVEFLTNERYSLGCLMVQNGETVKAHFAPGDNANISIEGNKVSRRLADFIAENATLIDSLQPAALNSAIESYVAENPDDEVSGILLSRYYDASLDPERTLETIRAVSPAARPAAIMGGMSELNNVNPDSLSEFTGIDMFTLDKGLLTFAPEDSLGVMLAVIQPGDGASHDSVIIDFNAAYDSLHSYLKLVELAVVADTVRLRALTDSIKPRYDIAWMPGGVANPTVRRFNIKNLPMIIVADSAGTILYRGESIQEGIVMFTVQNAK